MELKPCPFCGKKYHLVKDDTHAKCIKCGIELLLEEWNTRPLEDAIHKASCLSDMHIGMKRFDKDV